LNTQNEKNLVAIKALIDRVKSWFYPPYRPTLFTWNTQILA
jgi:hypothetical protein